MKNRQFDQLLEFLLIDIRMISELNRIWLKNTTIEKIGTITIKVKTVGNGRSRMIAHYVLFMY